MPGQVELHPCYHQEAQVQFARIHLAVAPRCNIQCNYCSRRYDCVSENRPGVTSERLSPDGALQRLKVVSRVLPQLTVVGIAGPGDALANAQQTFKTFELVSKFFPDLQLCFATNGLALPDHLDEIKAHAINFVTITINAIDPAVGARIVAWARYRGTTYRGEEAAELLISQQQIGLQGLVEQGVRVKVNTVLIPGINDQHIPEIAKKVGAMGAYVLNITPLIPVPDTPFADCPPPSLRHIYAIRRTCKPYINIMTHCRQCRADAVGLLHKDRSKEFTMEKIKQCIMEDG